MKKLFYLLTLTLIISCSDSETIVEIDESDLLGTWNLISLNSEVDTKASYQGLSETSTTTLEAKDISSSFTFTNNPNEYSASGSMIIVSETSSSFGSQTDEYETESISELENGEWQLDGDELTFISNLQETVLKVSSFENNTLTLKQSIDQDYSDDGYEISISGSVTMKFER